MILRTRTFVTRKLVQGVHKYVCSFSSKTQTKLLQLRNVSKIAEGYYMSVVDTVHTSE